MEEQVKIESIFVEKMSLVQTDDFFAALPEDADVFRDSDGQFYRAWPGLPPRDVHVRDCREILAMRSRTRGAVRDIFVPVSMSLLGARLPPAAHSREAAAPETAVIETYDGQENFELFLRRNNAAIFRKFARRVATVLRDPSLLERWTYYDLQALSPARRVLRQPIDKARRFQIFQEIFALLQPAAEGGLNLNHPYGGRRFGTEGYQEKCSTLEAFEVVKNDGDPLRVMRDFYLRRASAGESGGVPRGYRKLYMSPSFETLPRFIAQFYRLLDETGVPISCSKVVFGGGYQTWEDAPAGGRLITEQGHRTFIIYPLDDACIAPLIRIIEEAEQTSGAQLIAYDDQELHKTVAICGGKAIVGADVLAGSESRSTVPHLESFDRWTDGLFYHLFKRVFENRLKKGEKISDEEVYQALQEALFAMIGKIPESYLSLAF